MPAQHMESPRKAGEHRGHLRLIDQTRVPRAVESGDGIAGHLTLHGSRESLDEIGTEFAGLRGCLSPMTDDIRGWLRRAARAARHLHVEVRTLADEYPEYREQRDAVESPTQLSGPHVITVGVGVDVAISTHAHEMSTGEGGTDRAPRHPVAAQVLVGRELWPQPPSVVHDGEPKPIASV